MIADVSQELSKVQQRTAFLQSMLTDLTNARYPAAAVSSFSSKAVALLNEVNTKLTRICISAIQTLQEGNNVRLINEGITSTFLDFVVNQNDFETENDEIGLGATSVVSLVRRNTDGQLFALKTLFLSRHRVSDYEPFCRELEILTRMHHPTILSLVGFNVNPTFITLTPYMEGGSLEASLKRGVQFTEVEQLKIAFGVAIGMEYLHRHQVVHRDMKPANIFLNENREPVVGDFGLSKLLESSVTGYDLLECSRPVGTPIYSPPEILSDRNYTKKSDVYSYGLCLYRLLCGKPPFKWVHSQEELKEVVSKGERPELPGDLAGPYRELITSCWDVLAEHRPSFSEIVHRISQGGFPGSTSEEFSDYQTRVGVHKMTGRDFELDLTTVSEAPASRHGRQISLGLQLEINDSHSPTNDWERLDIPPEDEFAFVSGRTFIPQGCHPPRSPVTRLSSRKGINLPTAPIFFPVVRNPLTPPVPRAILTDLVAPAGDDSDIKARADGGEMDAQVSYAKQLRKNKRYEEAAVYWRMAADSGNVVAKYYLAEAFRWGLGVSMDIPSALQYYNMAADQNIKEAMFEYGILRRKDNVEESDLYLKRSLSRKCTRAQRWFGFMELEKGRDQMAVLYFRQAADQGDTESQYRYGKMLREGQGTPKNLEEAQRYFRMASKHPGAMFELAMMIKEMNPEESHGLLEKAFQAQHPDAIFYVGQQMLNDGRETEGLQLLCDIARSGHTEAMTLYATYQLDRNNTSREVVQFLEAAVKKGSEVATVRYAELIMKNDPVRAVGFLKQASEHGNARAQYVYGVHLMKRRAFDEGTKLLRSALQQGYLDAIWPLSEDGKLLDRDEAQFFAMVRDKIQVVHEWVGRGHPYALYWLAKLTNDVETLKGAAERDIPQAQCDYAFAIRLTQPVESDNLLRKALKNGSSVAQLWFARINLENNNRQKGMELLRMSASQGNAEAQNEIGKQIESTGLSRADFEEAL